MATGVPKRVEFTGTATVLIRAVYNSGRGRLLNLSSTGCYVETRMSLLPQAQVRLQIVLPDEKRWIETEAVVAWENRGRERRGGLPPGYGLRFIRVPAETAAAIKKLLRSAGPFKDTVVKYVEVDTVEFDRPPDAKKEAREEADAEVDADGPPYPLRKDVIGPLVPEKTGGIFVLSYDGTQDAFIGRADEDLRSTLAEYVGEYAFFYFEVIERLDERFYRECELFHRFGGDRGQLDNTRHPSAPEDSGLSCPVCPPADPG
jgi:uncharacterized protein (TIGR02266 family)